MSTDDAKQTFVQEVDELLEAMEAALLSLEENPHLLCRLHITLLLGALDAFCVGFHGLLLAVSFGQSLSVHLPGCGITGILL